MTGVQTCALPISRERDIKRASQRLCEREKERGKKVGTTKKGQALFGERSGGGVEDEKRGGGGQVEKKRDRLTGATGVLGLATIQTDRQQPPWHAGENPIHLHLADALIQSDLQ